MNKSEQEILNGCSQEIVNDISDNVHLNDIEILDHRSDQMIASDPAEQQDELTSAKMSSIIDQATDSDALLEKQTATLSDIHLADSHISDVNENEDVSQTEEQEIDWSFVDDSSQYYGWICQGEQDGYAYYSDMDGIIYSVDQSGFWYFQEEIGAEFQPCNQTVVSIAMKMYPLNAHGQPVLPINEHGERIFPTDANHMPIFPIDCETQLPTFPVDDFGQPVFPTGTDGRPIVPVDPNGIAIFPLDKTGHFIFPSGANGSPMAPVNIYGIPVLPFDETGKPVIPYDDNGMPLIHLASDGITPLTEEEYQYSLQWNDYYENCNQYYNLLQNPIPHQETLRVSSITVSGDTVDQPPEKNLKFLKKVRPEDIDLPHTEPPRQSSDAVPISMTPDSAKPEPEPPLAEEVEKMKAAEELKAKTKRLMEMQLRFCRKTSALSGKAKSTRADLNEMKKSEELKSAEVDKSNSNEIDSGDKTVNHSMVISSRTFEPNGNVKDMKNTNESVVDNTETSTAPKATSPGTVPAFTIRSMTVPEDANNLSVELDTQNKGSSKSTAVLESAHNHDVDQDVLMEEKSAQMAETKDSSSHEIENGESERPIVTNGKESVTLDAESVLFVETLEAYSKKTSHHKSSRSKAESLPAAQSISSSSKHSNKQRSVSKSKSGPHDGASNECPVPTHSSSSSSEDSRNERQHHHSSSHRLVSSSHDRRNAPRDPELARSKHAKEKSCRGYDHEQRDSRSRSSTYPRYLYQSPSPEMRHHHHHNYSSPRQESACSRSPYRRYSTGNSRSKSPNRSVRESRIRHHSKREQSSSRTRRYVREKSSRKRSRSSSPDRSASRAHSSRHARWEHSKRSSSGRHSPAGSPSRDDITSRDRSVSHERHTPSLNRSRSVSSAQSSPISNHSITILNKNGKKSARNVQSSDHSNQSTEQQHRSPGEISTITQRSENDEQIQNRMNSKEIKKDKKKKHQKRSSSSRMSRKNEILEMSGTLPAKKNGRRAVEQTTKNLVSHEDDLEREDDVVMQDSDLYGPQPPKQVVVDEVETADRVKRSTTKDSKSKKDKSEKKKKRRKKKKKDIELSETEEKDERKDTRESVQENENGNNEIDGIEPGEILEHDQEPTPTSFVDESEGLSVVFIGPKWEASTTKSEQAKVMNRTDEQNRSKETQPPKQFYAKFIRETLSTPIITFTSNPVMAESFVELKKQFDDSDGPRRSVQASKHFQTAMEILSESANEYQNDNVESSLESKEPEAVIPQVAAFEETETAMLGKWKSLRESRRERHHERKKAKKEKKQKKRAREKDQEHNEALKEGEVVVAERSEASDRGVEESGEVLWFNADAQVNGERQRGCNFDKSVDSRMMDRDMAADDLSEAVPETTHKSIRQGSLNDADMNDGLLSGERRIEQESSEQGGLEPAAKRPKHTQLETVTSLSESRKVEKGTQADEERVAYKREMVKRKMEEEEEDELSRLRYEALRSKTKRLMNDLRAERRRLKRERLRATLAIRRARGYDDEISVDDILMVADTSESSNTDESGDGLENRAEKIISLKKKQLVKRARLDDAGTGVDSSKRNNRSSNAEQNNEVFRSSLRESSEDGLTTAQRVTVDTVASTSEKSQSAAMTSQDSSDSSNNDLISELQKRIGGTNRGALQLLEQLKRSLMTGRCANIHLNPERIRNSP